MTTVNREDMQRAIEQAINRSCGENDSNTPDFILAAFLMDCFDAFTACSLAREQWYGHQHAPGQISGGDGPAPCLPPATGGAR